MACDKMDLCTRDSHNNLATRTDLLENYTATVPTYLERYLMQNQNCEDTRLLGASLIALRLRTASTSWVHELHLRH